MKPVRTVLRVVVAAGLLAIVLSGDTGVLFRRTLLATPWLPLLFTVQTVVGAFIEAERLRLLVGCFGLRVERSRAVRVVLGSAFFSACIPGGTGGDVMKFFYLDPEQSLGRARLAAVVVFDRAVGLGSLLVAASIGAGFTFVLAAPPPAAGWLLRATLLALGGALVGLWSIWSRVPIVERWRRAVLARLPFSRPLGSFVETLTALRQWPGTVLLALLLSTVGQLLLGTAFFVAGRELMPEQNGLVVGALGLLGLVANVIPITPGGLGVGEVAFNALFRLAGATGGARLVLLWRIGAIPVIVTGGLLYAFGMMGLRRPGRRAARAPLQPPVPGAPG